MSHDLINALFELLGAALQWMNVMRLLKDRKVSGVLWHVTAFFAAWGAWNIFFYSAVQSPLSAWAASFMTAANVTWVWLALKYREERMKAGDKIRWRETCRTLKEPAVWSGVVIGDRSNGLGYYARVTSHDVEEFSDTEWPVNHEEILPPEDDDRCEVGTFPFLNPGKGRV